MRARQVLIIIPLAAAVGITAALALYYFADRSHSQLPAFRVAIAKQDTAQSVANHSPTTSPAVRRARQLREARQRRAIARRISRARHPRFHGSRVFAVSAPVRSAPSRRAASTTPATVTPTPVSRAPARPVRAPAPKAAPKPAPKPAPSSGGGGGGSFDDSG